MGNIIWLSAISGILVIVLGIWTIFIFKREETKMKKWQEEKETASNEMGRSEEYERNYLRTHTPKIAWIYAILIVVTIIVIAVYANK